MSHRLPHTVSMNTQTFYMLDFPDRTEIFAQSESGVLDVAEFLQPKAMFDHDSTAQVEDVCIPAEQFGEVVYQAPEFRPREFSYTRGFWAASARRDEEVSDFLGRYVVLRNLVSNGDYLTAARIISRSRKLLPFVPLVRYLFRDHWFMILALETLHSYDAAVMVDSCGLVHDDGESRAPALVPAYNYKDSVARLAAYCRGCVQSRTAADFLVECDERIGKHLEERPDGLVLPVVGTFARPGAKELSDQICGLVSSARRNALFRDDGEAGVRLERYLSSIQVEIRHEPHNRHDPNALAVWVRMPPLLSELDTDAFRHVGYLKRQIAAIVVPKLANGFGIGASLARVTPGELDVRIFLHPL